MSFTLEGALEGAGLRDSHKGAGSSTAGAAFAWRVMLTLLGALQDGTGLLRAGHAAGTAAAFEAGVV